jgi:TetR/AcrR family transcriptional regulator, transcriptional repressor for nem operon
MNMTAQRLMDLAEAHIRDSGYGGFSFRDLAAEIGIKSASVHHHFPTKATMAAAVAKRYGERFFTSVALRPNESAEDAISTYRSAFRAALAQDGRMCLCGVLGAEAGALAPEVAEEILSFFRRCIDDLSRRIGGPGAEARAFHVMATLEGAMMLARAYRSVEVFDQAVASLTLS